MLKWLTFFFSFMLGKFLNHSRGPAWALRAIESIFLEVRKLGVFLGLQFAFLVFFIGGIFISVVEGASVFDANGFFYVNALFVSGITMALLSLGGISAIYFLTRPAAAKKKARNAFMAHSMSSPVEEAVALLINDFIKSREKEREKPQRPRPEPDQGKSNEDMIYKYGIGEARELTNTKRAADF